MTSTTSTAAPSNQASNRASGTPAPGATLEARMPYVIGLRQVLHRIPELGYQEFKTAAAIRAELDMLGIQHVDGVPDAPTATVAWLGDVNKPCVALRADID